ncbi:cation diffusion facilitator family transporter containing protein [Loa loa]|uniref:Cation diffusion facilitator family transporter containing protein n=1 Tax=Loa loa TaxID=7209 RepID=A0A1I7W4R4_LOALO|nr:cation diffusion facilitator family transporter containing protein [Loa loa]EFO21318.1 cation diffusion facilitator family transporter containing protein [Loa loa]
MSRERSESAQNVANHIESINDGTPLYYCDRNNKTNTNTKKVEQSLYAVSAVTIVFIIIEFLGGYFANSLAIMTDAGHMVSDLLSFCVAIIAIKLAQRKPTKRLPFGYYRAEILGALISVMMIWALTAILVYAAIERIIEQNFDVDATVMLYTAAISVIFNIIMGIILHFGKTTHSHFGLSHNHHGHRNEKTFPIDLEEGTCKVYQNDMKNIRCEQDNNANIIKTIDVTDHDHHILEFGSNINIRAAFVHVLGDLLQSLGVLSAALIIKFTNYPLADPICTFVFSMLVMLTSFSVARDSVLILMEASPKHINVDKLYNELCAIEGVRDVHSLRVWSLTMDKVAISVHLDTEKSCDSNHVVHEANEKLKSKHGIHFITIQAQCICNRSVSRQSFSTAATAVQDILRK